MATRSALVNTIFLLISGFLVLSAISCEPLSTPDPPADYDTQAIINGFAMPDTIEVNQKVFAQLSYENVCGGEFRRLRSDRNFVGGGADSGRGRVTLTPVLHVYPGRPCQNLPWETVGDTIQFDIPGLYIFAVSGQNVYTRKYILVVPTMSPPDAFIFRFRFRDASGFDIPFQPATLAFPDRNITRSITADSTGIWDTVFTDASSKLRYTVSGMQFEAVKGYTSSATVILR